MDGMTHGSQAMTTIIIDDKINVVAIYAAIVSTGGLIWQVWQFLRRGPRLSVRANPNMKLMGAMIPDDNSYIAINVANNGDRKTTITHVVGHTYKNLLDKLRNNPTDSFIVTDITISNRVPFEIDAGSTFMSCLKQEEKIEEWSRTKLLYVGIIHSGSRKPLMRRIPPIKQAQ
jgi:hypothetical protein